MSSGPSGKIEEIGKLKLEKSLKIASKKLASSQKLNNIQANQIKSLKRQIDLLNDQERRDYKEQEEKNKRDIDDLIKKT